MAQIKELKAAHRLCPTLTLTLTLTLTPTPTWTCRRLAFTLPLTKVVHYSNLAMCHMKLGNVQKAR